MLKSELDNFIKDNFGKKYESTVDEFIRVECLYMADEKMSKEEAAKIWKALYFDQAKKRWEEFNRPLTEEEILKAFNEGNDKFFSHVFFRTIRNRTVKYFVKNYTNAGEPMWACRIGNDFFQIYDGRVTI